MRVNVMQGVVQHCLPQAADMTPDAAQTCAHTIALELLQHKRKGQCQVGLTSFIDLGLETTHAGHVIPQTCVFYKVGG